MCFGNAIFRGFVDGTGDTGDNIAMDRWETLGKDENCAMNCQKFVTIRHCQFFVTVLRN